MAARQIFSVVTQSFGNELTVIHHLIAHLDVKPDAPFVDADHEQDLGSNPTPEEIVGLATHMITVGTREKNREKADRAINEVANMAQNPTRLLAVTLFPDVYPYANLQLGNA